MPQSTATAPSSTKDAGGGASSAGGKRRHAGGESSSPDDKGLRAGGEASRGSESLRIGDVAKLVGTTPRTIRYYEEIGLIPQAPHRASGSHRIYTQDEVERLREAMRLKHLLGISLDELKALLAAEEARSAVRAQLRAGGVDAPRRRMLLEEALGHIEQQLTLVNGRAEELAKLQRDLSESAERVRRKLGELESNS